MASRPMRVTDTPIPNMDKIFPKEVGLIGSSCQSITIKVIADSNGNVTEVSEINNTGTLDVGVVLPSPTPTPT